MLKCGAILASRFFIPQSRLFELVQTLRLIEEPVRVQVVAERDIFTSGPLEVELISTALNVEESEPETGDGQDSPS